jgi:hypothetical protein
MRVEKEGREEQLRRGIEKISEGAVIGPTRPVRRKRSQMTRSNLGRAG